MVALGQVEIPIIKVFIRQRGQGYGALAQVIERSSIPVLVEKIVPGAERVGANLIEFAARDNAEFVGARKVSTQLPTKWEDRLRKNICVVVIWKKNASRVIAANSAIQTSRSLGDSFSNLSH